MRRYLPCFVLLILAGAWFRLHPLQANRFHPDEALYAHFAQLIASGRDVLLAGVVIDKPPLSFYLTALSLFTTGGGEFAARLPTFYADLVSIALVAALSRRLYSPLTALTAATIWALSPFAILFAITIFQDTLMTTLAIAGLLATVAGRRRRAGLFFALAFGVKQTAVLLVPLAIALAFLTRPPRPAARLVTGMLLWLALAAALFSAWDLIRRPPVSFWEQGYTDNLPGRLIRSGEVLPRARAWLEWAYYFTASPPLNWLFVLGLPILLICEMRHPSLSSLIDLTLAGYLLLYLAGYWLLAFNVWDRYLLAILPIFVILLARLLTRIGEPAIPKIHLLTSRLLRASNRQFFIRRLCIWQCLPPAICAALLLPASITAARSGYPIGGDHGAYDGIDDTARFIRTLPPGSVLYDHWLGWELSFYLFDGPVYVSWFPTPAALTEDLLAFGNTSPRYLVIPAWEAETEVCAAAARAGFDLVPLHVSTRRDGAPTFTTYRLKPLP